MNILITGSSGFLSKEFVNLFSRHNLFHIDRQDLLHKYNLENLVLENNIQFIIHTSWAGVGAGTFSDLVYNLAVQENIEHCSSLVKKIFLFGSGAEFKLTDNVKESSIDLNESNHYCIGKNIVAQRIKKFPNIINLRLFGCFGKQELPTRFIKNSVTNIINGSAIQINQDKYMDFIYIKDLYHIICHYMNSNDTRLPQSLNCVYTKKQKLSEIASFLNDMFSYNKPVQFKNSLDYNLAQPYTGSGELLNSLNIPMVGLEKGILELYGQEATNFRSRS